MNMKKFICAMLLLSLFFTIIISCGESTNTGKTDETSASGDTTDTETTTAELKDNVPAVTFGGTILNILEFDRTDSYFGARTEIYSEGEDGEIVNDAIYRRNMRLEERFDIKIISMVAQYNNLADKASKSIMANDGAYDIILCNYIYGLTNLVSKKLFMDFQNLPYIELSQIWWDQKAISDLSIAKKLFFCANATNLTVTHHTYLIHFNKGIVETRELENPYELVREGKWTIDKMYSLMKTYDPRDLNGDGIRDELDEWGFLTGYTGTSSMVIGTGERLVSKDKDDIPYVSMNTPRTVAVVEKIFSKIHEENLVTYADILSRKFPNGWAALRDIWRDSRALVFENDIGLACVMRDMADDFGLIPMPKFDEAQESYHNPVTHYSAQAFGIPITTDKLEATGAMLEAMACESYKYVVPVYYETMIKEKVMRDQDTVEMLELIAKTRVYDPGFIYNFGGCYDFYVSLTSNKGQDFSSSYAKIEKKIISDIDKFVALFTE